MQRIRMESPEAEWQGAIAGALVPNRPLFLSSAEGSRLLLDISRGRLRGHHASTRCGETGLAGETWIVGRLSHTRKLGRRPRSCACRPPWAPVLATFAPLGRPVPASRLVCRMGRHPGRHSSTLLEPVQAREANAADWFAGWTAGDRRPCLLPALSPPPCQPSPTPNSVAAPQRRRRSKREHLESARET